MKKIIFLMAVCVLFTGLASAEVQTFASASTAAEFLSIPAGTRPAGLGNAFTGAGGDIHAIYYNPAGLAGIKDSRVMLAHNSWIEQINLEYLLYAQPVKGLGVLGAGLTYINFGAIERWTIDSSGNPIPSAESYTPYALAGVLACALPVGKDFSAGAGLKLAYDQIDNSGNLSGALDLGINYQVMVDLTAGLAIKNIGLAADDHLLPLALCLGGAYNLPYSLSPQDMFTVFIDMEVKYDENPVAGLGVEYTYLKLFQVRIGWNQNFGQANSNRLGFTAGAGITYQSWILDYAIAPQGDLGLSHKVGLQYGF